MQEPDTTAPAPRSKSFSFVEILIVFVILGILAALVVPQFSNAADAGRGSALANELRSLRTQIMIYRSHHGGVPPGFPAGDLSATPSDQMLVAQLTQYTDAQGRVSPRRTPQHVFGPYLKDFPVNPIAGNGNLKIVSGADPFPGEPGGPEGWVYQPRRGVIAANSPGADAGGVPFFDY